ncbi:hypothetical protein F5X68DRAFT_204582 [Plectosphaerella plurivora]|uniref:Uncharacterized protein n=1 Tax=Plectosphaerella plurivora TaxID=936078 RepID=A0A9P8VFM5_9PEZI|nr:hypothetical protein F5X68DRAFT_204582 [Plectosphaerella plurivora]
MPRTDREQWYVAIIREETTRLREVLPLATRNYIQSCTEQETDSYFGDFWVEVHRPAGAAFENETVANCIDREIICIERVLRRALGA